MARSLQEIQQQIIDEKGRHPSLQELNSTSDTAIWRLWTYVVATSIQVVETMWDAFRSEIEKVKKQGVVGTPAWYVDKAKEFQQGDSVIIDPVTRQVRYQEVDESKQIIKRAAIVSIGGVSQLKVATENNGKPVALSPEQKEAFTAYIRNDIQLAGARINILSDDADLLYFKATIYYNPLFNPDDVKGQVEATIEAYVSNLPFNGVFSINRLIDSIQSVEGQNDIEIEELYVRTVKETTFTAIERRYRSLSGYLRFANGDELGSDPDRFPDTGIPNPELTFVPE